MQTMRPELADRSPPGQSMRNFPRIASAKVGRIMRVFEQNAPGHVLNQGVVVFHAGANIARQWSDFQQYSHALQNALAYGPRSFCFWALNSASVSAPAVRSSLSCLSCSTTEGPEGALDSGIWMVTSLPDVHRCIMMIKGDYVRQADGAIAAMEGFATVASLGAGTPALRSPIPRPVPRTTLPTSARSAVPSSGAFAEAGSLGAARAASVLTRGGSRVLGNLSGLKDMTVAAAIRARGGGGNVVNQVVIDLRNELVGNVANLAATGDSAAVTAIKLVKQAKRLGQSY